MLQPAWMAFFNADLLRPSEDAVFPHAGCVRYQAQDWRSANRCSPLCQVRNPDNNQRAANEQTCEPPTTKSPTGFHAKRCRWLERRRAVGSVASIASQAWSTNHVAMALRAEATTRRSGGRRRWLAPGRRSACTRCRATRAIVRTSAFGSLAELGVFFGIGGWHLWRWVAPATVIHSEQPVARIAVLPLLVVMNQQTTAMIQQQVQKCRSK